MSFSPSSAGSLEVIVGGMFSGKTEALITRLRRALLARQKTQIFKPVIDNRYATHYIISHNTLRLPTIPVGSAEEIVGHFQRGTQVVGIDEAQFLGNELIGVCRFLISAGCRVIVAGLDMDYRGEPFEPMPYLMAIADEVVKQRAICVRCGRPALFSQRLQVPGSSCGGDDERVKIGGADTYEARCRACFVPAAVPDVPLDLDEISRCSAG